MDTDTQDIIKQRYNSLPEDLKKAITAADLPTKLQEISKKYSLLIDQAGDLQIETMLVMLALESYDDFEKNLVKNVGISREMAKSLTDDINNQIFKGIRSGLQELQVKEDTEETRITKEDALKGIENPAAAQPSQPINALEKPQKPLSTSSQTSPQIPFIDHLLTTPVSTKNEVSEKKPGDIINKLSPGPDPYREPLE